MELVGKTLVTGSKKTGGKWARDECVGIALSGLTDCVVFSDQFFIAADPMWMNGARHRIDVTSRLTLMEMEWSEWI